MPRICIACALKGSPGQTYDPSDLISDEEKVECESQLHLTPESTNPYQPTLTARYP